MRVVVSGATGTIGAAVVDALRRRGDAVVALSRNAERGRARLGEGVDVRTWAEPTRVVPDADALAGADAVVHLLGERIDQRWTAQAKREIRDSRVLSTRLLVQTLHAMPEDGRPRTLVSQSASGIYGDAGDRPLDESAPPGDDFLADVVVAWECEAQAAEPLLRVVRARTGVVLSPHGGALLGCCRSSRRASAAPWRADGNTSRGCTWMTSSERCCGASTTPRSQVR